MGCNCGGTRTVTGPVTYEVTDRNGRTVAKRSPSEARAEAARTGGTAWRVQDGQRRRL